MASNPIHERQQAHALLDMLPDEKLAAIRSLLQVMVEPLSSALYAAAEEHEEISAKTAGAIERARSSLARGEGIAHEEVLREFGFNK